MSNSTLKESGKVAQTRAQLEVMARELGDGGRLPGVRELRERLGVSLTTLQKAMGELEKRGVIFRRQGSGIYVSPRRDVRNILMLCDYSQIRSAGHSPFWDIVADKASERAASQSQSVRLHFTSALEGAGAERQCKKNFPKMFKNRAKWVYSIIQWIKPRFRLA